MPGIVRCALIELVAGAISQQLLTDEVVTLREWVGGGLIVVGAYLAARAFEEGIDSITNAIEEVASGQKLIIFSILFAILTHFLVTGIAVAIGVNRGPVGVFVIMLSIVAIAIPIIGLVRLAAGLGYSTGTKILLIILMFVPFINVITLLVLSSRATKILRAAGYSVGLLGARKD